MRKLARAREILREEGLATLARRTSRFTRNNFTIRGGLSARGLFPRRVIGLLRPIYNAWFDVRHGRGVDVMSESWDTLVLFDACRYDDFARVNWIEGDLQHRISRGADSARFIRANFRYRTLHDCVYVTANPHVNLLERDTFHATVDEPLEAWDSELRCVPPEAVTAAARDAHERFPDKRIIVHYMQPHDPPLGEKADELRRRIDLGGYRPEEGDWTAGNEGVRLLEAVAEGRIDVQDAREAYRETLARVLDDVGPLLEDIDGRRVVSADHGELFGERPYPLLGRLYEHFNHPRTLALCKVPWLVVEDEERREVVPEPPLDDGERPAVEEQLEALGYR